MKWDFDEALVEEVGALLGAECARRGAEPASIDISNSNSSSSSSSSNSSSNIIIRSLHVRNIVHTQLS